MKKLSIVIPVYNRAHTVGRTLDCIEAQTSRDVEVIIVDNNSTDASYAVVQEWITRHSESAITYRLLSETRQGAAYARAAGANVVTTPYLAFFDSDDTLAEDYAQTIIETFESNPSATLIYWKKENIGLTGKHFISRFSKPHDLVNKHIFHAVLNTIGYATTTDFYRRSGGWDGSVMKWDDWELGIRLLFTAGFHPIPVKRALVTIHYQEVSITGCNFSSGHGGWEYAIERAEEFAQTLPVADRAHLLNLLAYKRMVLAGNYAREGAADIAVTARREALKKVANSARMRLILNFTYFYVSHGWRGCASLVGRLI